MSKNVNLKPITTFLQFVPNAGGKIVHVQKMGNMADGS